MRIAFVGDVHGCVLHALGSLALLQTRRGIRLDAVVQVGDLGAHPSIERFDGSSRDFHAINPAQRDFVRLLDPPARMAEGVRLALEQLPPVLFVSGNHEDHAWLAALHEAADAANTVDDAEAAYPEAVPVDPLGAFRHVACGRVVAVAGQRVAFLGLIDLPGKMDFDEAAYRHLLAVEPGSVDVLVTHDAPRGLSRDRRGDDQGSAKLSALLAHLQPRLHVGGHYHHANGPRRHGRTVSYALAQLVETRPRKGLLSPTAFVPRVAVGSIGLLDTATYAFEYVHDEWLGEVSGDEIDLVGLLGG